MPTLVFLMSLLLRVTLFLLVAVPLVGLGVLLQSGALTAYGQSGPQVVPWLAIALALGGWGWFLWPD